MLIHRPVEQSGFSLIELAIVVTILALVVSFSVPAFTEWTQNTQIRATAESIQSGLQSARAEAVRRNAKIEFRLSDNVGAEGATGWRIVEVASPKADVQKKTDGESSSRIVVTASPNGADTITFDGSGRTPLGSGGKNADASAYLARIDIDSAALSAAVSRDLRIVIDGVGGQIRMCDPNATSNNDPRKCP